MVSSLPLVLFLKIQHRGTPLFNAINVSIEASQMQGQYITMHPKIKPGVVNVPFKHITSSLMLEGCHSVD